MPSFAFETRNVPCLNNPLGVKGAGEAGAIGSCPAVMNAIVDALWRAYRIAAYRHAGDAPAHLGGDRGALSPRAHVGGLWKTSKLELVTGSAAFTKS